jgi:2-dehydro-3-deoxyphosphogluconate aldolase/(4S)-4-hydroxy-2-oxoglutarate aldolase
MPTTNHSVESILISTGFVPVFYHPEEAVCLNVLRACYDAGLRAFEFTNRGENAFHIFRLLHEKIQSDYPDMKLGAGTIFSRAIAAKFIDAGAEFIVSPALIPEMKEVLKHVPWIPGCATVSEVHTAHELGATLIKVFPGELLGPVFIRSVLSVMPDLSLMPTGGVEPNRENLSAWFGSGVACVGMGSRLFTSEFLEKENHQKLIQRIQEVLQIIREVRQR